LEGLEIRDVNLKNADDLINLCIPPERRNDPLFIEGIRTKKRWITQAIEKYGSIAKLAYINSKPVGLIQYRYNLGERLVEIDCIFVPEEKYLRRGIGRSLLNALIEDVKKREARGEGPFLALVTWAFQVPGLYPQHEFYQKMGFKRVEEDNPFLLYYPLEEGYVHKVREKTFIPQKEDTGKALIFYDPSCPFCIYFSEKIKEAVREVAPEIPVRMINMFEEPEEVKKRGRVPHCAVNGKPIETFFMDKENFQREVKKALS